MCGIDAVIDEIGGIGGAVAKALHAHGATVAISGTRTGPLEELAAALGDRVHILPANLSERAGQDGLVPAAEAAMGQLDILVNNAGITRDGLVMRMKDDDWDQVIEVNLSAGFRLARASIRGMVKRRFGRIVGIGSVVGTTGNAGQVNYAAAKAGMIGMTKALAHEVAGRGITANVVSPGFIQTAMTDVLNDKQREGALAQVPVGRLGTPEEIAAAVVFLASREAAYVTGQTIHVNGGMVMV